MLKDHQKLASTLAKAEEQAVAIEKAGGNVQSVIHQIRQAGVLVANRIANYQAEPEPVAETQPATEPTDATPAA